MKVLTALYQQLEKKKNIAMLFLLPCLHRLRNDDDDEDDENDGFERIK